MEEFLIGRDREFQPYIDEGEKDFWNLDVEHRISDISSLLRSKYGMVKDGKDSQEQNYNSFYKIRTVYEYNVLLLTCPNQVFSTEIGN